MGLMFQPQLELFNRNPQPSALTPSTLNPQTSTLNPTLCTKHPRPYTLNPKP